jgi:hypothetical protein
VAVDTATRLIDNNPGVMTSSFHEKKNFNDQQVIVKTESAPALAEGSSAPSSSNVVAAEDDDRDRDIFVGESELSRVSKMNSVYCEPSSSNEGLQHSSNYSVDSDPVKTLRMAPVKANAPEPSFEQTPGVNAINIFFFVA